MEEQTAESRGVISMHKWKRELQAAKVGKGDMDKLMMNFLVSEGYAEAVKKFGLESGTKTEIDLATVTDRMKVKKAVQAGRVAVAVENINNMDPEILKKNPETLFNLERQFFIELIWYGKTEDAMIFAREKLAPMAETNDFLEEFERAFSLLVLGSGTYNPNRYLLSLSQRIKTASNVNEAILISQANDKEAKLSSLLKMLAWVDKKLEDKVIYPRIEDFSTCIPKDPAAI